MRQIPGEQPHHQCQGGDGFEINDRPERQPPHGLNVAAMARHTDDQGAEHQRHDE